jgi:hypothetical protein
MSETKKRRPFHETIVDHIREELDVDDLDSFGRLIMATKIPKNHDAIISAWEKRCRGIDDADGFLRFDVLADLLLQRKEAEAEAKAKEQAQNVPA